MFLTFFLLLVLESVKITQQPDATPGIEGQKLVLECRATGVPAPTFMWFKDPRNPLPDQTSDTLVIPKLRKEDAGKYCCRAQNGVNVIFSAWVEVKVLKPSILQAGEEQKPGYIHIYIILICQYFKKIFFFSVGSMPHTEDMIG